MTQYQRQLLNQLMELNWEIQMGDYNEVVMGALRERYAQVEEGMADDMGREEWQNWMAHGRRMFQPA
jgi:hypothetical protein